MWQKKQNSVEFFRCLVTQASEWVSITKGLSFFVILQDDTNVFFTCGKKKPHCYPLSAHVIEIKTNIIDIWDSFEITLLAVCWVIYCHCGKQKPFCSASCHSETIEWGNSLIALWNCCLSETKLYQRCGIKGRKPPNPSDHLLCKSCRLDLAAGDKVARALSAILCK